MDEVRASNGNNYCEGKVSNHDQKELVALDCGNSPSTFKISTLLTTYSCPARITVVQSLPAVILFKRLPDDND